MSDQGLIEEITVMLLKKKQWSKQVQYHPDTIISYSAF